MNARIPQAATADLAKTHFSQTTPISKGGVMLFADESNLKTLIIAPTIGVVSINLHVTQDEAVALANSILDAVDWCKSAPARQIAREQQAQADSVACGERPQFSGERVPAWVAA